MKADRYGATVRTLLRYPGGKSRAAAHIINHCLPKDLKCLCSPFFGGGSIEIALANRGIRVFGYDNFKPLVTFWQVVLQDADRLADKVLKYENMTPALFRALQKGLCRMEDEIETAAVFYALSRSSFSGTTLSGGMSPGHPRFNRQAIERLKNFSVHNLTVKAVDFHESIQKHTKDFLYCDPPYDIFQKLYGVRGNLHEDFDHEGLAKLLNGRDGWLLSYNDSERIRDLYPGCHIQVPELLYSMNSSKKSNELLIFSKDLTACLPDFLQHPVAAPYRHI